MEQGIIEQFVNAIKQEPNDKKTTYSAIVSRIDEEGVIWVYVAGSDKDTPTAQTGVEVSKGDNVTVEWRNNKLYIAGNYSNPSAGVVRVSQVELASKVANQAAEQAVNDAGRAREAAELAEATAKGVEEIANHAEEVAEGVESIAVRAEKSATQANRYAITALQNLSDVEKVVDTITWIAEHGTYLITEDTFIEPGHIYYELEDSIATYSLTTDTALNPHKQYYILEDGEYLPIKKSQEDESEISNYYEIENGSWSNVSEPVIEDISKYYQLNVSQGVSDYVSSHLALTDEGLSLTADNSKYRALLAVDGMKVIDPTGEVVGLHGETIRLGKETEIHFEATSSRLKFCTSNYDICWFGQNDNGIWEMHIDTAYIEDMMRYGDYAFIKRKNGNMSLKWLGD